MVFSLKNNHATVKPIELLKYLLTLIVGKKEVSIVMDMYFGSGSVGLSAAALGIPFVGIEIDDHYYKIAVARCKAAVERTKNKII
jgi:DNA modification methylase